MPVPHAGVTWYPFLFMVFASDLFFLISALWGRRGSLYTGFAHLLRWTPAILFVLRVATFGAGGHRLDSDRVDGYARQLAVLFGSQQVLKWGQTGNGSVPEVPSAGDIN